jgi:hypothetical protein
MRVLKTATWKLAFPMTMLPEVPTISRVRPQLSYAGRSLVADCV